MNKNKIIILTGPSCVGKTPLINAFKKIYPQQAAKLKKIVLYNSRTARPVEKEGADYYFRIRQEIEQFRDKKKYILIEVRGDLQALDTEELLKQLNKSDVFYEGNTYIAKILMQHEKLKNVGKLSIFVSPFSLEEITLFRKKLGEKGFQKLVFETMKVKLIHRTENQGKEINDAEMENINRRAADAYQELNDIKIYDVIIPNHDGEDSDNWNEPIPENSDAYLALIAFSKLIKNEN